MDDPIEAVSSSCHQNSDIVDVYLKKHKLDLKLLPNKKMIKLSDLSSSITHLNEKSPIDQTDLDCDEDDDSESKTSKRTRKKREPSLKLQQKLTNQDLESIVSSVRAKQAQVFIADVKKDDYVDKILRVKLNSALLSNGSCEALLKKSMFPKDLNSLFDTFTNSLCGQDLLLAECGTTKPTLKCLVVDCDFNSFSEAEIMRHIKRHLAQDGYTCPECSHQFASMTNLQRHLRIHSGEIGKEMKCPHCDYKASTITHVKRHMAHKHLERSLPCPHCSFMGATNAELKIHMARKHLELTGKNPLFLPKYLRKDYQCSVCKEQFNDFKEYQTHMYEHTSSSNRFRCTECAYNCKNYSKLKRHMLYHMGARNYECKLCGNKFFQMEHLKRHMQSIHNTTTLNSTNTVKKPDDTCKQVNRQSNKTSLNKQFVADLKQSGAQGSQQGQAYTILSKCLYKCQKCEFTSEELFDLNQHVLSEHLANETQICMNNNSYDYEDTDESEEEFDNENMNNDFELEEEHDQDSLETDFELESIGSNKNKSLFYTCSFCSLKSNKKSNLKIHLQNNHSSDASGPILLTNDALILDPNTKFQCGSCNYLLENLDDFTKHMNDKHKISVFLVDSVSAESSQAASSQETNSNIKTHNSDVQNQSQYLSNLKRSYPSSRQVKNSQLQSQQQQAQTTVRINPLYLKQSINNSSIKPQYQTGLSMINDDLSI